MASSASFDNPRASPSLNHLVSGKPHFFKSSKTSLRSCFPINYLINNNQCCQLTKRRSRRRKGRLRGRCHLESRSLALYDLISLGLHYSLLPVFNQQLQHYMHLLWPLTKGSTVSPAKPLYHVHNSLSSQMQ